MSANDLPPAPTPPGIVEVAPERTEVTPYQLDVAVDREKQFLKELRAMIREEVVNATRPAVAASTRAEARVADLAGRVDLMGSKVQVATASVERIDRHISNRGLADDARDRRIEKLLDLIGPLVGAAKPPA